MSKTYDDKAVTGSSLEYTLGVMKDKIEEKVKRVSNAQGDHIPLFSATNPGELVDSGLKISDIESGEGGDPSVLLSRTNTWTAKQSYNERPTVTKNPIDTPNLENRELVTFYDLTNVLSNVGIDAPLTSSLSSVDKQYMNHIGIWTGTQTEYDSIISKNPNTLYFIVG